MLPGQLDAATLDRLRELIEANFNARDALYVAAESLEDDDYVHVCIRLADSLAGHAAELQQVVAAAGDHPPGPNASLLEPKWDFEQAKAESGSEGILAIAERTERDLRQGYDRVLEVTCDRDAEGILDRQRSAVEFGEQVLRCILRGNRMPAFERRSAK